MIRETSTHEVVFVISWKENLPGGDLEGIRLAGKRFWASDLHRDFPYNRHDGASDLCGPCWTLCYGDCSAESSDGRLSAEQGRRYRSSVARCQLASSLHRQPTPGSVANGRQQVSADERQDRALLDRARTLDEQGDERGCREVLTVVRGGQRPR